MTEENLCSHLDLVRLGMHKTYVVAEGPGL